MVLAGAQGAGRWVTIRLTHKVATVITTGGDRDEKGGDGGYRFITLVLGGRKKWDRRVEESSRNICKWF